MVSAAVTFDPRRARGLDGALRTLLGQPHGFWLALAVSAALATFGVHSLAEARYRQV